MSFSLTLWLIHNNNNNNENNNINNIIDGPKYSTLDVGLLASCQFMTMVHFFGFYGKLWELSSIKIQDEKKIWS